MKYLTLAAALALAACQPEPAKPAADPASAAAPAEVATPEPAATPAKPSGPPATLAASPEDDPAAYVTDVKLLENSDAKIFSTAGGDPAINGLYTFLAVYNEDERGWTTFQIGDFNSWNIIEDAAGKVVLEVSRSWLEGSGDIKTATEKLIVAVPASGATSTTVTPAT